MREPGSGTRNVLERSLASRNLTVDSFARVTQLGSLNLIKRLVLAGMGIAFFYQPVVEEELASGKLREIPLADCSLSHDFSFLWQRGSVFSPELEKVFSLLQNAQGA